ARDVAQALDLGPVDVEDALLRRRAHELRVLLRGAALHGRGGQEQQPAFLDIDAFAFCFRGTIETGCSQQQEENQNPHSESKCSAIFLRAAASGRTPKPAATLSAMCSGLPVPGIVQVIAGWPTIHLRKYWAQLAMPSSVAQGGSGLPRTRRNIAPSAKERFAMTAMPLLLHFSKSVFS